MWMHILLSTNTTIGVLDGGAMPLRALVLVDLPVDPIVVLEQQE
jgi:hypothetical protein